MDFITALKRGDHLIWDAPHVASGPVFIVVTRVARDESWADLELFTWAVSWHRRMPLPMPRGNIRFESWDAKDLLSHAPT